MDIDELKSPALYFGTTTGQLGSAATAARRGAACSIRCRRFIALRRRWCKAIAIG